MVGVPMHTGGAFMILGIPIVLITAIAVYMVVTVISTEYLKKIIFVVDTRNQRHSLMLSWLVGLFLYWVMYMLDIQEVTFGSCMLFIIITGLLNTGYRFTTLKHWIRRFINSEEKKYEDNKYDDNTEI